VTPHSRPTHDAMGAAFSKFAKKLAAQWRNGGVRQWTSDKEATHMLAIISRQ
jgi:hypothetical protein